MTPPVPTIEPTAIAAGNTWRWDRVFSGYTPADGWALKYAFRYVAAVAFTDNQTKLDYTAPAAVNGGGWEITIPKTVGVGPKTEGLTPGTYRWQAYVEKATERYTVAEGVLTVRPNFESAAVGQLQSHAEKTLAIIEAALEGRLTSDIESYQIAGRAISKIPIAELSVLHGKYLSRVQRERNPGQLGRKVEMVFVPPR